MKPTILRTYIFLTAAAAAAFGQIPDFLAPAAYPTGGSSAQTVVADFNRDHIPDVLTYESATQTLSIMFGKPDGTLSPPVSRPLGLAVSSMAASDFNGDGAADLVLSSNGGAAVLLNAGDGTFAAPQFYGAGIFVNYVTTGDVNHDGIADLIFAGADGFSILRGLGSGAFSAPSILPAAFGHFWVGVADFNGDGNLDLISDGSPSSFYAGNGDGTFAPPVNGIAIPYGVVTGDFNSDGKMDLAYLVTTFNQERVTGQQVSVLIGTGTGQFLDALDFFFPGNGPGHLAAGDFKGRGRTDLAIWLPVSAKLMLVSDASSQLATVPVDLSAAGDASLTAADLDGNGSGDLVLVSATTATLLRNTHGNPPLPALASVARASVIGGVMTQGSVTLGGPAPASGATVTLSSSDPALAFPVVPTVTIPPGATTATFSVSTAAVAAASPVNITATYNSVTQTANLALVAPYALSGLTIDAARQFGGFTVQGTIVLSGPADAAATVYLSSSNGTLVSLPASVTVPAGATSASFPITLQPAAADTAVSISASMTGVTRTAAVTILRALDTVRITKAEDAVRSFQLKVEATSTSAAASLTVWNATTGALIGTLTPGGGGKYTGSFTVSPAVLSITVKSSLGGITTGAVAQK